MGAHALSTHQPAEPTGAFFHHAQVHAADGASATLFQGVKGNTWNAILPVAPSHRDRRSHPLPGLVLRSPMPQFTRHTTTPSPRDTTRAVRRSRQARNRWAVLSIDVLVLAAALCMATVARYDGTPPDSALAALLWNLPFVVLLQYVLLLVWRVPRRAWSYLTLPDLPPIVLSLGVAGLLLARGQRRLSEMALR